MAAQSSNYYGLQKDAFKVNIAIDFGTDGLGLAYAIGGRVYLHSKWNSRKFGATTKPKTILLLDSKGQVNSFGMDAKMAYMTIKGNDMLLFERFKMSLYDGSLKSGVGGDQKKSGSSGRTDRGRRPTISGGEGVHRGAEAFAIGIVQVFEEKKDSRSAA